MFVCSCQGAAALPEPGQRRGDLLLKKDPSNNRDKKASLLRVPDKTSFVSAEKVSVAPPRCLTPFQSPSNRYDKNGPIVSPLLSISWRNFSRKKTPFTNRDRNKALLDIFGKGSAFSAKAACPLPPSGSLGNHSKTLSIHMTKTSHLSDQFGGFCERNFSRRNTPLHYVVTKKRRL